MTKQAVIEKDLTRKMEIVKKSDEDKMEEIIRLLFVKEFKNIIKNSELEKSWITQFTELKLTDILSNRLFIVFIIRQGISYNLFDHIQNYSPFSLNDWASYLNISSKSLSRYRQFNKPFKPIHTEKIIEIAEVTNLGLDVFKNNDKFKLWLETPNYAMGNMRPFELLKDSYGKEMVIGELTRIEFGILV
jgi:putative toxin-antitoxin system antitoxin component (TIGR02293 family)